MTNDKIIQQFVNNICPYCKGNCEKGIVIVSDTSARCVDYEKGEVKGYERPLEITAKHSKPLMRFKYDYYER